MAEFDLVIRGGTAATAVDVFRADVGVRGGCIVALAADLPAGKREVDATGLLVLPGGVDGHCHLDQPTGDGTVMADDFESGTRSAACGGTPTLMPFAAQMKGGSLRDPVTDYHHRARDKAFLDYAFHLIVTDGLYPRKGAIATGADLAIWDPAREVMIANAMLQHNVEYTPHEGMRVRGWPVTTISRGEIIWSDGKFDASGRGRFLACDHPQCVPARSHQERAPFNFGFR